MSPALQSHSIDQEPKDEPINSTPDTIQVSLKQVQEVCTERMLTCGAMKRGYALYFSARLCLQIPHSWLGTETMLTYTIIRLNILSNGCSAVIDIQRLCKPFVISSDPLAQRASTCPTCLGISVPQHLNM